MSGSYTAAWPIIRCNGFLKINSLTEGFIGCVTRMIGEEEAIEAVYHSCYKTDYLENLSDFVV